MPGVPPPMPPSDKPCWQGDRLDDGTLLLVADQGFGDTIQFVRYIPLAARRCRELVIACSAEMAPLVAQLSGKAKLFRLWRDAPGFDCHARLSSLPRLFNTEIDTIPAQVPYLRADKERAVGRESMGAGGEVIGDRGADRGQYRHHPLFLALAGDRQRLVPRRLGAL